MPGEGMIVGTRDFLMATMAQTAPNRKRFSPEIRRAMILDEASKIIALEGVAGLSMERISREAKISKALVYRYFENLTELLRELLDRELRSLRRQQFEGAEKANTFEELVRNVTHAYISYIDERGLIIERLQNEPSISDTHNPTEYDRETSVSYFARIVSKQFDLPLDIARALTDISFGLPAAAGVYLSKGEMPRDQIEDLTVAMILGTINAVRSDYLTRMKPLEKKGAQK